MAGVYEYGTSATLTGALSGEITLTVMRPDGTEEVVEPVESEDPPWTAEVTVDVSGIWTWHATDGETVETGSFYVRPAVVEVGS